MNVSEFGLVSRWLCLAQSISIKTPPLVWSYRPSFPHTCNHDLNVSGSGLEVYLTMNEYKSLPLGSLQSGVSYSLVLWLPGKAGDSTFPLDVKWSHWGRISRVQNVSPSWLLP